MTGAVVISTATASRADAERIADALLDAGLAACVQLFDIQSRYVWKGERHVEPEVLLLIKTRADLYDQVAAEIRRLHAYETPEILATLVERGDEDYLGWIADATRDGTR